MTRQHILETAGQLFADLGYANTTSKQVCENSNSNVASVNYHFENKEGLYRAVLLEAHERLLSIDILFSLSKSPASPEDKLRLIITVLIERVRNHRDAWALKVLSRELLSPSSLLPSVLEQQAYPKAKVFRGILGQILGLPDDHPTTLHCALGVFAPCLFLLLAHEALSENVLPGLEMEPAVLIEHMMTYALAGLKAVSAQ
ncbi:TetR/AcrR family transcriptional regulator [Pseudomonas sp. A34-9]|uniref:TetR/AcrR family transcriptional regulator n=1 Tax=Pseudomonas sp. A34-9 TaxID=3034675 RepID=UPI00240E1E03|nr:TetR/AcrR family transcriptional regulator [Pseudomonas sp. A34-9]